MTAAQPVLDPLADLVVLADRSNPDLGELVSRLIGPEEGPRLLAKIRGDFVLLMAWRDGPPLLAGVRRSRVAGLRLAVRCRLPGVRVSGVLATRGAPAA